MLAVSGLTASPPPDAGAAGTALLWLPDPPAPVAAGAEAEVAAVVSAFDSRLLFVVSSVRLLPAVTLCADVLASFSFDAAAAAVSVTAAAAAAMVVAGACTEGAAVVTAGTGTETTCGAAAG